MWLFQDNVSSIIKPKNFVLEVCTIYIKTLDAVLVIDITTAVCDVSLVIRLYGIQHVHFADYVTHLLLVQCFISAKSIYNFISLCTSPRSIPLLSNYI
jgi:hypothetical protein